MKGLKGRFILSLNDRPEVRELFVRFAIEETMTTYHVAAGRDAKPAPELIVSN